MQRRAAPVRAGLRRAAGVLLPRSPGPISATVCFTRRVWVSRPAHLPRRAAVPSVHDRDWIPGPHLRRHRLGRILRCRHRCCRRRRRRRRSAPCRRQRHAAARSPAEAHGEPELSWFNTVSPSTSESDQTCARVHGEARLAHAPTLAALRLNCGSLVPRRRPPHPRGCSGCRAYGLHLGFRKESARPAVVRREANLQPAAAGRPGALGRRDAAERAHASEIARSQNAQPLAGKLYSRPNVRSALLAAPCSSASRRPHLGKTARSCPPSRRRHPRP